MMGSSGELFSPSGDEFMSQVGIPVGGETVCCGETSDPPVGLLSFRPPSETASAEGKYLGRVVLTLNARPRDTCQN